MPGMVADKVIFIQGQRFVCFGCWEVIVWSVHCETSFKNEILEMGILINPSLESRISIKVSSLETSSPKYLYPELVIILVRLFTIFFKKRTKRNPPI